MGFGNGTRTSHGSQIAHDKDGKRTKAVVTDNMVAHLWANQSQDHARTGNGNFYFNDSTIYSYGRHFPCGHILADGVVLLNSDSYSPTTSQHKSMTRGALSDSQVRHYVPSLDSWLDAIGYSHAETRTRLLREYAQKNGESVEAETATYLARSSGMGVGAWRTATRQGIRDRAARVASIKARDIANLKAGGKTYADMSATDFAALWPADERPPSYNKSHGTSGQRFAKELARMHKATTAAKTKGKLWDKLKIYRAHLAGEQDRLDSVYRNGLAAEVVAWRKGGKRPAQSWRYKGFAAIERAIVKSEAQDRIAESLAAYQSWLAGDAKRPALHLFPEGSAEHAAIEASEAWERGVYESAFLAWQADRTQPRPPSTAFGYQYSPQWNGKYDFNLEGDELAEYRRLYPFSEAATLLRGLEQSEKAAKVQAERQAEHDRLAAMQAGWLNGLHSSPQGWRDESGGALIRAVRIERDESGAIIAGELQTSLGASVPLVHAVKVFRFLKAIRQRGKGWKANGHIIRVGHFNLDRIERDGSFSAACHKFSWPEVERLAVALGVFELPASDAVVIERESV